MLISLLPWFSRRLSSRQVCRDSLALIGPSPAFPFGPRGRVNTSSPRLKSLRLTPLPLQNLNTPKSPRGSRGFWSFRPGCGRFYHQWTHEGLSPPGPYEPSGHSMDICCHQFVDLQGIFTPCGSSGCSSDCDWRSFGSQILRLPVGPSLSPDGLAFFAQSRSPSSTSLYV